MKKKIVFIFLAGLFLVHLFLRFSFLETKNSFGWDQVDNAWAAKNIVVDGKFPLLGMVAKGNSGIYIGPAYYYLISIVYFFTKMDPIASGIFAGITSIISLFGVYYVSKKLFTFETAIIASIIQIFSFSEISFDRVQWPVDFIPVISLLIFYTLHRIISGEIKYLTFLAIFVGFAFNIHFTAIFFPLIIFLSLPFFPWNIQTIKYILLSIPLFLIWLVPNIISEIQNKSAHTANFFGYAKNYFHGFHLRRVEQLFGDAFIQFEPILMFKALKFLKYIIIPIFYVTYLIQKRLKERYLLCYLVGLWFIVPWFVFATYSGEISDYYFSINKFIGLVIVAYLIMRIWKMKFLATKVSVLVILLVYCGYSIYLFSKVSVVGLSAHRTAVKTAILQKREIRFTEGDPQAYLYYFYKKYPNK